MSKTSNKFKFAKFLSKVNRLNNTIAGWMASRPLYRCRKHRIRCDRDPKQCDRCNRHNVKCTYLDIPKKRGPKSKIDKCLGKYFHLVSNVCPHSHEAQLSKAEQQTSRISEQSIPSSQPTDLEYQIDFQSNFISYPITNKIHSESPFFDSTPQFPTVFANQLCLPIASSQLPYKHPQSFMPHPAMCSTTDCFIDKQFEAIPDYDTFNYNTFLSVPSINYSQSQNHPILPDYNLNL